MFLKRNPSYIVGVLRVISAHSPSMLAINAGLSVQAKMNG
jgi:hypothetical protein